MLNRLKTDGAWSRANKNIRKQVAEVGAFTASFKAALTADKGGKTAAYIVALTQIGTDSQVMPDPITVAQLAATYSQVGIPREVWYGYFRFDTWSPGVTPTGGKKYTRDHEVEAREFGAFIRDTYRTVWLVTNLRNDVKNVLPATSANPGGIADDNKVT